jgi:chemotaxis protein MotB
MSMEEEDSGGGIPEWVVTFGDMMSLLLTFFIMLVSLSEIKEEERYQALVESMTKRFGYDSSMRSMAPGKSKPRNTMIADLATVGRAKRIDVMSGGDTVQAPAGEHPHVRIIRPGEKTNIGTVIYFHEGSVLLSPEAKAALRVAAESMGGKPQKIEVRGHTTHRPLPANSPYEDHMLLGFSRARTVRAFLTDECGIDGERIRCSSAGAAEPQTLTADPNAQRANPRVEIFMLDEVVSDLAGTAEEQAQRFIEPSETKQE